MTSNTQPTPSILNATMQATLAAPKAKKVEASDFTREQITEELVNFMREHLPKVLPETMSQKRGLKFCQKVIGAVRDASQVSESISVNLESDPINPEFLLELPKSKGALNALEPEAMKETISKVYGAKPRGQFDRQKWADKLSRDREANKVATV